jgi:N-acetylneuraminic acid mutarotase
MSYRSRSMLFQALEKLEPRSLFHGDGFSVAVNFQPASSVVPDGYIVDSGLVYGDRGNGLSYGWNANNTANTRDRDSSLSKDQRYDTFDHMQKNGSNMQWNIAVPNGDYTVHIVSGDATATDSAFKIAAEGTLVVSGKPSSSNHWVEGTETVTVKDGKLTVTNASGSANNKICFIDIDAIDSPETGTGPDSIEMSTPDASASERNLDAGTIRFTRSGAIDQDLTVNYFVTGTASPDSDYQSLPGSIVIPAGQKSANLVITPIDDSLLEPAKSVQVQILPGDYEIGTSKSGVVTIVDDESSSTEQPYFGDPKSFSGTFQAEDFDQGPNGVAYGDKTAGNASGAQVYRFSDVDIAPTTDAGGGFAVTHIQKDESLKYTVNIPETGTYRIETRIASTTTSGSIFHISFDGKSTGSQTFSNTGGLETWKTLVKTANLTAGVHVMKFYVDSAKASEIGSLNYIRIYRDLTTTSGVSFKSVAALPFAREEGQSATLGGKYDVFGGLFASNGKFLATARVDQYDPATNMWTRLNDMPEAITHAAVVQVSETVAWFIGGYLGNHPGPGTTHVWIYDSTTDTWSAGPDLPAPRGAGGGGVITTSTPDPADPDPTNPTLPPIVDQQIHFFGGRDYNRDTDETTHWVFDLNAPDLGWQTRAPLPSPRNHLSGAVIDGKLYAIAGEQLEESSAINSSELDVYDPATDTWSRVADLPLPLSHVHQSTLVVNNKIITLGGELVHNTSADQVLMYDPAKDLWSIIGYLPSPRRALMAGVLNGQIIATGGYLNGKQYTNTWMTSLNI